MQQKNIWLRKSDMAKKHGKTKNIIPYWLIKGILIQKTIEGGVTLVKESATFSKAKFNKTK